MEHHTTQRYRLDAERIRVILGEQSLKHWWVAEFAGVHKTTLRRWLSGRIDCVRGEHAARLASVLEVPLEAIAHRIDERVAVP